MATPKPLTARYLALTILNKFSIHTGNAAEILHSVIHKTDHRPQATDLVFGVIRNRPAIDMVITKIAETPTERIGKKLLNILRIAVYELVFTPHTAQYAIVNEAVNLAGQTAGKKQAGFTNALLRKITRNITNNPSGLTDSNAQKTIPQSQTTGCQFNAVILPDPQKSPDTYLAGAFSLPQWLIAEWLNEFGFKQTRQICLACNRRPGIFIRPNSLKTSAKDLTEKFMADGIEFKTFPDTEMIKINSRQPVFELTGFEDGLFTVQDPAAAKVAAVLAPKPGQTILDLCAAPGTKTTHLAELIIDTGRIIATDIDARRLQNVKLNCDRLGITAVDIIGYDKLPRTISKIGPVDAVLLDVPCSNTGVLARRCEVRLKIKPQFVKKLSKTQLKLLKHAAEIVTSGGKICYSTCSILKQENTEVLQQFLCENLSFKLEYEKLTLPTTASDASFEHDGGYVAIIKKSA